MIWYVHRITNLMKSVNVKECYFIRRICSISSKNWLICGDSNAVDTDVKWTGRISFSRWQDIIQCSSVCTACSHIHSLSSRGVFGMRMRPVSILRLWLPVLYLVVNILSNSNLLWQFGVTSWGLTCRYAASFEFGSVVVFSSILRFQQVLNCSSSLLWQSLGEEYNVDSLW